MEPSGTLGIELFPFVVYRRIKYGIGGEAVRGTEYGLFTILRAINTGSAPASISALEITGDVDAGFAEWEAAYVKDGDDEEQLAREYRAKRPFRRISWIAWPSEQATVLPKEERFLRFTICPLTKWMSVFSGKEGAKDYFGYRDGTSSPKYLSTHPEPQLILRFGAVDPSDPTFAYAWRMSDEARSGQLKFSIRVGLQHLKLEPKQVRPVATISEREWSSAQAQSLCFDRTLPFTKDPAMTLPKP